MTEGKAWEWLPEERRIVIYKDGLYELGPPDQAVWVEVKVGGRDGADNKPSGDSPDQAV